MIFDSEGNSYQDSLQHAAGNADPSETESEGAKPVTPKTLYIIRHGSTDMNNDTSTSQDFIRGWNDIPLNDEGRKEAKDTGVKLADMEKPTVMHHSDLDRAEETAGIIGKKIGVEPTPSRELRPWDLGYLTGKSTEEALPVIKDYIENKPDQRVPKGESFNEFKERAFRGVFNALRSGDSPVAIVTHHRVERLLEAWDKAGQPDDLSIDVNTFGQKGDPPAGIKTLQIGSKEAETMSHTTPGSKEPTPLLTALANKLKETNQTIGDLMTGKIDPASEEGIGKVTDLAMKTVGYGMLGSEKYAAGIFGGRLTRGAKELAERLEKLGMSEEKVKYWSGLERGAEGMWRNEIDDSKAALNIPTERLFANDKWMDGLKIGQYKLGEILNHDELFKAYPELKDMIVNVQKFPKNHHGDYGEGFIRLNNKLDPEQAKTTLIHEIQHAIQDKEGFSLGAMTPDEKDQYKGYVLRNFGNLERVKEFFKKYEASKGDETARDNVLIDAYNFLRKADYIAYRAQAHEQEAFNTGTRLKMSRGERYKSLGKSTEEIGREHQIKFNKKSEPYL